MMCTLDWTVAKTYKSNVASSEILPRLIYLAKFLLGLQFFFSNLWNSLGRGNLMSFEIDSRLI